MKKAISLLLSFIMAFSVTTGIDFSSYALTSGDFNYILLDDGTAKITGYNGSETDLIIPSEIDGHYVTSIGEYAFYECDCITNLIIANSVTNIGEMAFGKCTYLEDITIPDNVEISDSAFDDCPYLIYTITYNVNGGKDQPSSQQKRIFESIHLTNEIPSKDHCKFKGWATKPYGNVVYEPGAIYTDNTNIILYAIWEELPSYKIKYYAGNTSEGTLTKYKDIPITLPKYVLCENVYVTVLGWAITPQGRIVYEAGATYTNNANITLYAVLSYKIEYYDGNNLYTTQDKNKNESVSLLSSISTKNGYKLKGWATTPQGDVVYEPGATYTDNSDITLYAVWKELETYTIEYYVDNNLYLTQIKTENKPIYLSNSVPQKTGYKFMGWAITPAGNVKYNPGEICSIDEDITLYAIWKESEAYAIEYYVDNNLYLTQIKFEDEALPLLNSVPKKTNKRFIGWATEKNGNIRYKPSDEYTENKDITLYAVWIDRCSDCDGTGKQKQKQKDCPQCKGKGYKDVIVDCSNCNGTGETIKKVEYVTCGICHGAKVSWSSSLQSYIPCPFCSATGQVKHEIKGQCSICYGKGTVIKSVKCSSCNGTGKFFSDDTCYTCHGTGVTECMYETSTVKPTCDKMGYTLHKCKHCKKSYKDNYTKVLGHKYDKGKTTKQATCTANGVKVYTCSQCKTTKTETIKAFGHKYTTKVVKPTYTSGGYTLHTCTRCKKSYKDKKTKKLVLKNTSISKITAAKKVFTIKWKKQSAATGYQIQYSTSSKFKGAKTVTISKNKTTSKKVTKLKAKKKYYVRIRTYKIVKVNGKNTKVYSGWSKTKTVKTK